MAISEVREVQTPTAIKRVTEWVPRGRPKETSLHEPRQPGSVRWIELEGGPADATGLVNFLGDHCNGELTDTMIKDLLTPDEQPEGKRYAGGNIGLASAFSLQAERVSENSQDAKAAKGSHGLSIDPIELLAGSDWLITCWHPRRTYKGATPIEESRERGAPPPIFDEVANRWQTSDGTCAGDLGVLIMYELALSYAPAYRRLYQWLEDWELALYMGQSSDVSRYIDEQTPRDLLGSMAVMREWIGPLNISDISNNLDKAWLPVSDGFESEVECVDDRIDRALNALRELGKALRSAFNVLHIEQLEVQRIRREKTQFRIEMMAAAFLIPTLVVGFYGANTWVPGQQEHWGFWVMVVIMVALGLTGLGVIRAMQTRRELRAAEAKEEHSRLWEMARRRDR